MDTNYTNFSVPIISINLYISIGSYDRNQQFNKN